MGSPSAVDRDCALYFPYIDVPRGQWLLRVLLYWDQLGSIVPYDFVRNPEQHSETMRELLVTGLVTPIVPAAHLQDTDRFGEVFLQYVRERLPRRGFGAPREARVRVHIEKLGRVGHELELLGVARRGPYPWYSVDAWVAERFMAYLACVLAATPDVNAAPITFDDASLRALREPGQQGKDGARAFLLQRVFPRPSGTVHLSDLVNFKSRYETQLRNLRREVERRCVEISAIDNPQARRERAASIADDLDEEIGQVEEAMRLKFGRIALGGIVGITSAGAPLLDGVHVGAAVGAGAGVIGAVGQVIAGFQERRRQNARPLAYAALARRRFHLE
jgi:hypothetical protein